jgi:hypothetical protein
MVDRQVEVAVLEFVWRISLRKQVWARVWLSKYGLGRRHETG